MTRFAHELAAHIERHGPITVADYMARANAHYYATRDPLGSAGDFTTAPEISQIFGELIGAWLLDRWQADGCPEACFAELGPGRGTLLRDGLRVCLKAPSFAKKVSVHLVETSPTLKAAQAATLAPLGFTPTWHEAADTLPAGPLYLVANEFFDALPVAQYCGREARRIGWNTLENFHFLPAPDAAVTDERSPVSTAIMTALAARIRTDGGAALIIDYGYQSSHKRNTLQAVRGHRYSSPLETPGDVDITCHVDFSALKTAAKNAGAYPHGIVSQGTFLKRLGAELRALALCRNAAAESQTAILSGLARLVAPDKMGVLFQVLAVTRTADLPAGF